MKILALELSSARGSIALLDGTVELFAVEFANDRKHSGEFFRQLRACVSACGNPERIAAGLGPGSYAGSRIAIAAAIGLQAATGAELIGLASLRAIPTDAVDYAVIGDARRQTFYYAQIRNRRCIEGPLLCSEDELHSRIANSDIPVFCTEQLKIIPSAAVAFPSASLLAQIAATEDAAVSEMPLEPIYLRDAHITQPKSIFAGTPR